MENLRRAGGVAVACLCAFVAVALLVAGLDLSLGMCGLGGCSQPDNERVGGFLLLGGMLLALAGLILAPRIARSSRPTLRAAVAVPVALAVGLVLVGTGVTGSSRPAENVTLFLMVVVAVGFLVPPRGFGWFLGVVVGAVVAAAFGDVPFPGIALALVAVVVWTAVDPTVARR